MIRQYVDEALRRARYEKLEDGTYYAEVPRLRGVLATAPARSRHISIDFLSRILRQAGVTRKEWERV